MRYFLVMYFVLYRSGNYRLSGWLYYSVMGARAIRKRWGSDRDPIVRIWTHTTPSELYSKWPPYHFADCFLKALARDPGASRWILASMRRVDVKRILLPE